MKSMLFAFSFIVFLALPSQGLATTQPEHRLHFAVQFGPKDVECGKKLASLQVSDPDLSHISALQFMADCTQDKTYLQQPAKKNALLKQLRKSGTGKQPQQMATFEETASSAQ